MIQPRPIESSQARVLLDFDPRGQVVAARRGGLTYLSTTVASASNVAPPPGTPPPTGSGIYAAALVSPTGGLGSGDAELEQRATSVEFKVEAEDIAAGEYAVKVGGIERGRLRVTVNGTRVQGELEFRAPVEPGKLLLDFDPRGQRVDVVSGTTMMLTDVVPNTPTLPRDN